MTATIWHEVHHHRWPPIMGPANHDPLPVRRQVRHADDLSPYRRGHCAGTQRQRPRPLPVPRVKTVLKRPVERHRRRRQAAGVHVHPTPLRHHNRRPRLRTHRRPAPTDRDRRRAFPHNVDPHLAVRLDLHRARRGFKREVARAAADPLDIERPRPAPDIRQGRQGRYLRLAPVGHPQERAARHFQLHRAALVHPERVMRQDQRVHRGETPVRILRALDHRAARVIADPRVQQRVRSRRGRRKRRDTNNQRDYAISTLRFHHATLLLRLPALQYKTKRTEMHSLSTNNDAALHNGP